MWQSYREIDPKTFEREWRQIHDSVFSGHYAYEAPFHNPAWEVFLLPYEMNMEEGIFNAIALAGQTLGDSELIMKDAEIISPPEPAVMIRWSYSALQAVEHGTLLVHFETHGFGRSGSWGIVWSKDDFSCLGGEPAFMDAVAEALGGRDAIRERFMRFAATEWQVSEEFRRKLFNFVGWDK